MSVTVVVKLVQHFTRPVGKSEISFVRVVGTLKQSFSEKFSKEFPSASEKITKT